MSLFEVERFIEQPFMSYGECHRITDHFGFLFAFSHKLLEFKHIHLLCVWIFIDFGNDLGERKREREKKSNQFNLEYELNGKGKGKPESVICRQFSPAVHALHRNRFIIWILFNWTSFNTTYTLRYVLVYYLPLHSTAHSTKRSGCATVYGSCMYYVRVICTE